MPFLVEIYFLVRLEVMSYTLCIGISRIANQILSSASGHVCNGKRHGAKAVTLALVLIFRPQSECSSLYLGRIPFPLAASEHRFGDHAMEVTAGWTGIDVSLTPRVPF